MTKHTKWMGVLAALAKEKATIPQVEMQVID